MTLPKRSQIQLQQKLLQKASLSHSVFSEFHCIPKDVHVMNLESREAKKEYNIFPQHKNTSRWFHTCEREFPYQSKSSNSTITKVQAQAEIAFPSTRKLSILTSQSFKSKTEPLILKQSILSELKTLHKTCCIDQTPQPYNNTTIRPPNLILATSCSSNVYKALKQHKSSNKLFKTQLVEHDQKSAAKKL